MMKTMKLGKSDLTVPVIGVGCMRISRVAYEDAETLVKSAMDLGLNFFDHADIYGCDFDGNNIGLCESIFGKILQNNPGLRDKILIQTKCGFSMPKPTSYDFRKDYIVNAAEASLKRLGTDHVDSLLLHIPDALYEPEEVAAAFDELHNSGKVRYFGVSNFSRGQLEFLRSYLNQDIIVNQLQFSLAYSGLVDQGQYVNMCNTDRSISRDNGVLDYCRMNNISIQCWSPMQYGFFEGIFLGSDKYPELNQKIKVYAEKYGVSDTAIALAWILRHPAHMQPIVGTTKPQRLKDSAEAAGVVLEHDEWYDLWLSAGNFIR